MVKLEVVQGKKGLGDKVVLITANREPLRVYHLLKILSVWFESEDSVYPPSEGYMGRKMLFKAICDVYHKTPVLLVLKRYKLQPVNNQSFSFSFKQNSGGET